MFLKTKQAKKYPQLTRDGILYNVMPNGGLLKAESHKYNDVVKSIRAEKGVYMIECKLTGKKYIGSTSNLKQRIAGYYSKIATKTDKGVCRHLDINHVKFTVLDVCTYLSDNQIKELELEYIMDMKTYMPYGFNHRNPVTLKNITPSKHRP